MLTSGSTQSGYAELRRLLKAGFELQSYQVTGDPMSATATLANGAVTRELHSEEEKFLDYCFSTHKTGDADGRTVLRRFRDGNRYWKEQEELCRDFDGKLKAAIARHQPGRFCLPTSPRRLIIDFLKANDRSNAKFLALKQYHFDIAAALLLETKGSWSHRRPSTRSFH